MGLDCKKNVGRHASTFDKLDRGYKDVKKAARQMKKAEEKKERRK